MFSDLLYKTEKQARSGELLTPHRPASPAETRAIMDQWSLVWTPANLQKTSSQIFTDVLFLVHVLNYFCS